MKTKEIFEASKSKFAPQSIERVDFREIAKRIAKYIKKNAKPWLAASNNGRMIFYRGTKAQAPNVSFAYVRAIRPDRRPMDTSSERHSMFDAAIKAAGGIANRSNSAFATANEELATEYGNAYVFIPLGKFHYTFSPLWDDWTQDTDISDFEACLKKSLRTKSDLDWDSKFEDPNSYDPKLIKRLIKTDRDLKTAFTLESEVMFSAPMGLYVDRGIYKRAVLPILTGKKIPAAFSLRDMYDDDY